MYDEHERKEILRTFRIIADSREQRTARAELRFSAFNVPVERATLDYGDYCAQIDLPEGPLHDTSVRLRPPCVIERKMSLDELATCFTSGRGRFQREFERAADHGARVFLLVENASVDMIVSHRYRSRLNPNAFLASLTAWSIRYGVTPWFCSDGLSGRLIRDLLYRDIRERLERGEFG